MDEDAEELYTAQFNTLECQLAIKEKKVQEFIFQEYSPLQNVLYEEVRFDKACIEISDTIDALKAEFGLGLKSYNNKILCPLDSKCDICLISTAFIDKYLKKNDMVQTEKMVIRIMAIILKRR